MIRELVMNALEAAKQASDRQLVEISPVQINGGLTGNFGLGAKVASLPSNQEGMRYRSCREGRVHEVILCKREGVYGRLRRLDPETGEHHEIIDVTELAAKDGRSLDEEWTEVVLFGNETGQDTVDDPYNGDPKRNNGLPLISIIVSIGYRTARKSLYSKEQTSLTAIANLSRLQNGFVTLNNMTQLKLATECGSNTFTMRLITKKADWVITSQLRVLLRRT